MDEQQKELDVRELNRRVNDQFSCFNPSSFDYEIIWNSNESWIFEGQKESIVPRYIAVQFFDKYPKHILNMEAYDEILNINLKRKKEGHPKLTGMEQMPYERAITLNSIRLQEIRSSLAIKMVSKYGGDRAIKLPEPLQPTRGFKTVDEEFDEMTQEIKPVAITKTAMTVKTGLIKEIKDNPMANALDEISQ